MIALSARLWLLTTVVLLSACGSDGQIADTSPASNGPLGGLNPVVGIENFVLANDGAAVSSELLTYRMPSVAGGVTQQKAVVLIPAGTPPAGGFPVVAWGHQSVGVANICAPSSSDNLAGNAAYLDQFLQNGFAVVAADFEGLGTDDSHPYLNLASGGRSILYAVDAAVQQYRDLSSQFAVVGHSQGGHAALGAAEYSRELPNLVLTGVVAIAPPTNLRSQSEALNAALTDNGRSLAERSRAAISQLLFSALVAAGVDATDTGFNQSTVFGEAGAALLADLQTECVEQLAQNLISLVVAPLGTVGNVDSIIPASVIDIPEVAQYLASNEPGTEVINVPVLLVQGSLDSVVFPESTSALNNLLRNVNGTDSVITEYPSADHTTVVDQSVNEVLSFVANLFGN
ncbi:hypothetical protein AB833_07570 [Chromatiales bacterium (ex Bugula neritina AB1)]|nr:hypothetical protein AB833_07570 [Chromatiales bacterium (ex Bugula neritina AB1)]